MEKNKLAISLLLLLMSVSYLFSGQSDMQNCCQPKPQGGFEALVQNTRYPHLSKEYHIEGTVIINFHVDENGKVSQFQVVQSGGPLFDETVITAIEDTKWSPATIDGKPIAVIFSLPFKFCTR